MPLLHETRSKSEKEQQEGQSLSHGHKSQRRAAQEFASEFKLTKHVVHARVLNVGITAYALEISRTRKVKGKTTLTVLDSDERPNLIGHNDHWDHCKQKCLRNVHEAHWKTWKEFLQIEEIKKSRVEKDG